MTYGYPLLQAWQDHLRRMEVEVKAGLQKSELAAQEAATEVKSATDRANNLGELHIKLCLLFTSR